MNLNFVPSLHDITLAKIAVTLCYSHEIRALLGKNRSLASCESCGASHAVQENNFISIVERLRCPTYANGHPASHHDINDNLLKQIQDRASDMISPLNLGRPLEKRILVFVPHIVLEVKKWEEDHSEVLPVGYDAHIYFCWKFMGTIDRESTAVNLLTHGNLSVKNRFLLACMYCMEKRLSHLWNFIYDSHKSQLISKCHRESLLNYWTARLDGLHSRRFVFPDASYITNASALQYFCNACRSEDQKRAFLTDVLSKHWKNLDLVRFCVFKLCQNSREELLSSQCRSILRCFLNCPLQSLFFDVAECLLVRLDQVGMIEFLHDILKNINTHQQYMDIDYLNVLNDIWYLIPSHCKGSLMDIPDFQPIKAALDKASTMVAIGGESEGAKNE